MTKSSEVEMTAKEAKEYPIGLTHEMPVISLWKPWANWIALGWKTIETRTHTRLAGLKGRRIGIHCAMKWDDKALEAASDWLTEAQRIQTRDFLRTGNAVIATAYVADHRLLDPLDEPQALIDCTHIDRYGLILTDIQIIEAIPCKGKQGIFYLPAPVARRNCAPCLGDPAGAGFCEFHECENDCQSVDPAPQDETEQVQADCACRRSAGSEHYTYHSEESCGVDPVESLPLVEAHYEASDEYIRGFNRCKELAEVIVDEHPGFLDRIGYLDPVTSVALPLVEAKEEASRDVHPTRPVKAWIDCDLGIAAHVEYLNTIPGVRTFASCQGTIGEGGASPYEAQILAYVPDEVKSLVADRYRTGEIYDGSCYLHPVAEPKPTPSTPPEAKTHDLKVWPEYYRAIIEGRKFFEIRKNDRDYKVGDLLTLREYNPDGNGSYTGYYTTVEVSYVLYGGSWGLPDDMCVMSILKPGQVGSPARKFSEDFGYKPHPDSSSIPEHMPKPRITDRDLEQTIGQYKGYPKSSAAFIELQQWRKWAKEQSDGR